MKKNLSVDELLDLAIETVGDSVTIKKLEGGLECSTIDYELCWNVLRDTISSSDVELISKNMLLHWMESIIKLEEDLGNIKI